MKMVEGKEAEGFCLRNLFFVGSQFSVGNESGRSGVRTRGKETKMFWSCSPGEWAVEVLCGSWVCIVMLVYSFVERGAEKPSREMPMAGD